MHVVSCLDPETVLDMLDGRLAGEQAATVEAHLDDCESCRRLVSEAAVEEEEPVVTLQGRLGPYELVGLVGRGGMGAVYRARDPRLEREVAVKVLHARRGAAARLTREARTVAAISHPNVVAVFDVGEHAGAPYVVTELLAGDTLRSSVRRRVAWRHVVGWAQAIALGLAAAHERGIVHRDLKPENVFVTVDGRIKILDFGLAIAAAHGPDDPEDTISGSLGYMAPEQLAAGPIDHRADIFALGCVLYELLTGRRAFTGSSAAEIIAATVATDPLEHTPAGLPPALIRIVRRCLEKDPARRFQSASDLAFALELLLLDDAPAAAAAVTTRRRAYRRCA